MASALITGWAVRRQWQWRRWRLPLAIVALIIVAGIVLALLTPRPNLANEYLNPADISPVGSHALADILGERGIAVSAVYSPADALAAVRSSNQAPVTLVITSPDLLPSRQLAMLARARADLFLVEPQERALRVLAPLVSVANLHATSIGPVQPDCPLPAAQLAGTADVMGITYGSSDRGGSVGTPSQHRVLGCYPMANSPARANSPALVRYSAAGRIVTILGSGTPLTNAKLADVGNAALAINLLSAHLHIVWLTPAPPAVAGAPPSGSSVQGQGPTLIGWAAWLVVLQLAVATVLAMIWRARRHGPLIAERLPVVVRASETVEGHARLYQSRRARDRAARTLREAMLTRMLPALGLPKDAQADAVTQALADRSRLGQYDVAELLYGPVPGTDAELISLSGRLDDLEREVRTQ
jgi:hypothetical protein